MIGIPSLVAYPEGGPFNELGEPCPWPYDPLMRAGEPLGMYHCPYCGAMVVAGTPHPDYGIAIIEFLRENIQRRVEQLRGRTPAGARGQVFAFNVVLKMLDTAEPQERARLRAEALERHEAEKAVLDQLDGKS